MKNYTRASTNRLLVAAVALSVAACGNGGNDSATTTAAPKPASTTAAPTTTQGSSADVAAAEALVAPYTGHPSAFPIDTPLKVKPTGKRIAFVDCGSPACTLYAQIAAPAFERLGMKVTTLQAGSSADSVQKAFDAVVQDGYDGVFLALLPAAQWKRGLEQLEKAGIPVVASGVLGLDAERVAVQPGGEKSTTRNGELLAGEVVVRDGAKADVVVYFTPELDFTTLAKDVFVKKMGELCPGCAVRAVPLPIASLGTTAANAIVADLQANPTRKTAVFTLGEETVGLPPALGTAGLKVETILSLLGTEQLESLQKGDFDVGLEGDFSILIWTAVDSLARLTTGQEPAPGAVADDIPSQFLTPADVAGDVSQGYSAYPDFADRFGALWDQAG